MDSGSHERVETQPLTGEYARVTLAFTAHAEVGTVTIKSTSNKRVTVDAVQLEGGKSWPASFFAVTGIPRPGEWVDIPARQEIYDPMRGAVAFWMKPQWIGEVDGGMAFFSAFKDPNRGWQVQESVFAIGAYVNPKEKDSHNSINIVMKSKSGQYMCYGIPIDDRFKPNEWFHLVVNWEITSGQESLSSCYINGNKVAEKRFFSDGMEQPANIYMGYAAGAYADALMDEFYLFNRPLTKEEISELYATTEALK